jgi:predicted ATP-grasp superfamily ATP-dependent carboligase
MERNQYSEMVRTRDPDVIWPVIQEYRPEAMENIYSIAGFVDARANIFVARGSRKIFQHPRRIGVGLCFDAAPVRPELAECIRKLCEDVGHYGAFEVEFIHTAKGDRYLMTDFNPRYYGQMGFEIARGLPIPLMVQSAATGDVAGLRALVADAQRAANSGARLYCHQFLFRMTLATQRMSGRLSRDEVARWEAWFADQAGRRVDAVEDMADFRPATLDRAQLMLGWVRHPRAFVRTMFLDA